MKAFTAISISNNTNIDRGWRVRTFIAPGDLDSAGHTIEERSFLTEEAARRYVAHTALVMDYVPSDSAMSFNVVTVTPSDRDKAAASSVMIAIQGSIPYNKVLRCLEEAIATAREEGREEVRAVERTWVCRRCGNFGKI